MLLPQERIPFPLKMMAFAKDVIFRVKDAGRQVFLTFDDGPIPESTPWLLDILEKYGAKATFFMVADNARRYPTLFEDVMRAGHSVGNHTFHHVPPFRQTVEELMADVALADDILRSPLFRPPHGLIWPWQQNALRHAGYRIVMFDLNTLDYRKDRRPGDVLESVRRNVREGAILNLHDSLKSIDVLKKALPDVLEFLNGEGYKMSKLI